MSNDKPRRMTAALAAFLGATAPAVAPPTAPLPPVAIVHELKPRPRHVRSAREVPKTPRAVARAIRARDKRAAKRAYRAARRAGARITWREAHRRAGFWGYLMSGGNRKTWNHVHARMAEVV